MSIVSVLGIKAKMVSITLVTTSVSKLCTIKSRIRGCSICWL
ncbi:hypothetical protein MUK42_24772 [Musa troglodytarum]|uniref:Uncharacterized protein n=1 Tax=Musa troglodytarum TaxID=320322 RepID=A0A9E7GHM1_9LILI|nr:hypothetical protein MUK42_24772 [Musa troglodytarum]